MKNKNFWIWDSRKLIKALRNQDSINEPLYGLFFWMFYIVFPIIFQMEINIHTKIMLLESFIGFIVLFLISFNNGDRDFLKKVVCLSLPITMRLFLVAIFLKLIEKILGLQEDMLLNFRIGIKHLLNIFFVLFIVSYFKQTLEMKKSGSRRI